MRTTRTRAILLALVSTLALTAAPRPARADDAAVAEAQRRFGEGLDLADAGKHEEARLKFQQAAAVLKAPSVLFNLARAEQLTGHDLEAVDHFRQFLRASEHDPKITDAMRDKARQHIGALSAKLGQIEVDVPAGARVTVDGAPAPEAPSEPVAVKPGRHVVEATFEGRVKSVTVDAAAGAVAKATIVFEAGGARDAAPAAGGPFTEPPPASPSRPDMTRFVVGGAIGAAGLVGVGLGVGFGLSSQGSKSDAEDIRRANPGLCALPATAACAAYDEKRSDAESAATISTVGYVAGGLLVAGAVATVLLWPRAAEKSAPSTARALAPWMTRDGAGAALGGSF